MGFKKPDEVCFFKYVIVFDPRIGKDVRVKFPRPHKFDVMGRFIPITALITFNKEKIVPEYQVKCRRCGHVTHKPMTNFTTSEYNQARNLQQQHRREGYRVKLQNVKVT